MADLCAEAQGPVDWIDEVGTDHMKAVGDCGMDIRCERCQRRPTGWQPKHSREKIEARCNPSTLVTTRWVQVVVRKVIGDHLGGVGGKFLTNHDVGFHLAEHTRQRIGVDVPIKKVGGH